MDICPLCNLEVETDDDNFYEVAVEGKKRIAHSDCYHSHPFMDWETYQDNEEYEHLRRTDTSPDDTETGDEEMDAVEWLQEQLDDMMLDAQDVLERFLAAGFISDEQVRSIYGSHILAYEEEQDEESEDE